MKRFIPAGGPAWFIPVIGSNDAADRKGDTIMRLLTKLTLAAAILAPAAVAVTPTPASAYTVFYTYRRPAVVFYQRPTYTYYYHPRVVYFTPRHYFYRGW